MMKLNRDNMYISYPGNYYLLILKNGMKFRILDRHATGFKPRYPECIDIKLSNKCSIGCPYCHENSTPHGDYADPHKYAALFSEIGKPLAGTEVALGGGALTELPANVIQEWAEIFSRCGVVVNLTINMREFENFEVLRPFQILCNFGGVGVSYDRKYRDNLFKFSGDTDKIVVHTIAGVTALDDYKWLLENHFKILVLGYKDFRRGHSYISKVDSQVEKNIAELESHIEEIMKTSELISFDNLACEQLRIKEKVDSKLWEKHFMGDEGQFTMYMDLVNGVFAKNSTTPVEERKPINFSAGIPAMFYDIRTNN